jgi:hypothetical protein
MAAIMAEVTGYSSGEARRAKASIHSTPTQASSTQDGRHAAGPAQQPVRGMTSQQIADTNAARWQGGHTLLVARAATSSL